MPDNVRNGVLLVGAGPMAVDYVNVLKAQDVPFKVIGRGAQSAEEFTGKTGIPVITGGLGAYLESGPELPEKAIVAVSVEQLGNAAMLLLARGVKNILLEKPAGLNPQEIRRVAEEAVEQKARVYVAYNRRFYAPTLKAREIIAEDGGVLSFNFEFTEWSHIIKDLKKAPGVMENWFLANSTHVVDLAFYLGGEPKETSCYIAGSLPWHPSASIFAGAGVAENGALFSYQANWEAPGRWGVEILTRKHRLIFRPMEQLHIQQIGSVAIEKVELDDELDQEFKPGLYLQTKSFLDGDDGQLLKIEDQAVIVGFYERITRGR
jgi:predicted dehydrogenase